MFATPDEAEHAFYEALEQADCVRLMQVWADDEEIVCIHPGGLRIVSPSAVHESWQQVLANGPLHIRPLRPLVMQSMMRGACWWNRWRCARAKAQFANCYATNIYHKGAHRLAHGHAPCLARPTEAGVLDLHDVPDMLH